MVPARRKRNKTGSQKKNCWCAYEKTKKKLKVATTKVKVSQKTTLFLAYTYTSVDRRDASISKKSHFLPRTFLGVRTFYLNPPSPTYHAYIVLPHTVLNSRTADISHVILLLHIPYTYHRTLQLCTWIRITAIEIVYLMPYLHTAATNYPFSPPPLPLIEPLTYTYDMTYRLRRERVCMFVTTNSYATSPVFCHSRRFGTLCCTVLYSVVKPSASFLYCTVI